jgi:thiol-disulfide isomerase/thioredoxin
MRKYLLGWLMLLLAASPARAGLVDLVNGVSVGKQLPANEMRYLREAPDPQARLTLIDFWATWCGPCRVSIPKLNALQQQYAAQGLAVIGATQETEAEVLPFLEKVAIQYPIGLEGKPGLHDLLKIRGMPYAIFVNQAGKIVWRGQPEEITDAVITGLLQ